MALLPEDSACGGVDAVVEIDVLDVPCNFCISLEGYDGFRRFELLAGEGPAKTHSISFKRHLSHVTLFFGSSLLLISRMHLSCARCQMICTIISNCEFFLRVCNASRDRNIKKRGSCFPTVTENRKDSMTNSCHSISAFQHRGNVPFSPCNSYMPNAAGSGFGLEDCWLAQYKLPLWSSPQYTEALKT